MIRPLYTRPLDSLLVTWGLSLIATQGTLLCWSAPPFPASARRGGGFEIGGYSFSTYRMVLFAASLCVLAFVYLLFMRTRFGVHARAVMQNAGDGAGAGGAHAAASTR